jgi:hypothetical protein
VQLKRLIDLNQFMSEKSTPTIVYGHVEGELVNSLFYTKEELDRLEKALSTRNEVYKISEDISDLETLQRLKERGVKEVELVGSFGRLCVTGGVLDALNLGLSVKVPQNLILDETQISPEGFPQNVAHFLKLDQDLRSLRLGLKYKYNFKDSVHHFDPISRND